MGRKIPGRKHHGVRDIEKQRQLKLLSLKDKINAPPANPDEQQIPKSLTHLMELKEKVRNGKISLKRKRKTKPQLKPRILSKRKPFNNSGNFKKPRGIFSQSDEDSSSSDNDDDKEEEILIKQMTENEKGAGQKTAQKLTKSQKWQKKLQERKLKKASLDADDFKSLTDQVKFGEVVHAPPTLSAPRKALSKETPRPGKKNLILKSIIENAEGKKTVEQKQTINDKLKNMKNKVIDKKAKRKNMPHALRRQLDKQQEEVVKAYKLLKSKKYNNNSQQ